MSTTQETLDMLKTAQANPDDLIKSFVQPGTSTTGLQAYNLEAPSKKLYPILTPLRNSIPRVSGGYAIQANWKSITNINVNNVRAGVAEGARGGVIDYSIQEKFAAFRGIGLENNVTFEANYASKNFEDMKALAVQQSLEGLMVQEERLLLGGNTSVTIAKPATATLTNAAAGAETAGGVYHVHAVALGLQAYLDVTGVNNGSIGSYFDVSTAQVPASITRTNADGSTTTFGGGSSQASTVANSATLTAGDKLTMTTPVVAGAVGYAWFVGLASNTPTLVGVTSINSFVMTTDPVTTYQAVTAFLSADNSKSAYEYDGLLYQAWASGSGAYIANQATGTVGVGTGLTSDKAGGIVEIETAFVNFYNKYRLSPTVMYVSSQELVNITKSIIGNNGAPLLRLTTDALNPSAVQAGLVVGEYLNKVTGQKVAIRVHPNLPAGTIFFFTEKLPYPMSNVGNTTQVLLRQDYYQLEWPLRTRKYEYGVYADGVLQSYAPFSMGIITNIGNVVA